MNKEQYIRSRFKDLLNETLEERTNDIKKNLYKEVSLNRQNKFDYIEEGKGMCESCGGMMTEGKCNEGCNLEENKSMC
jgi:tRNA(Ile)-lysidine synthase TilS/MesJ